MKIIFIVLIISYCNLHSQLAWGISDFALGMSTVLNLFVIIALSPKAFALFNDYSNQGILGEDHNQYRWYKLADYVFNLNVDIYKKVIELTNEASDHGIISDEEDMTDVEITFLKNVQNKVNHVIESERSTSSTSVMGKTAVRALYTNQIYYLKTEIDTMLTNLNNTLAGLINEISKTEFKLYSSYIPVNLIAKETEISNGEIVPDIFVVGYTDSVRDKVNNLPLIKKGICSTPIFEDFNGNKEFVIDCNLDFGNSGSPIYALFGNTYKLVGVVCEVKQLLIDSEFYNGVKMNGFCAIPSGIAIAIKTNAVFDLIEEYLKMIEK